MEERKVFFLLQPPNSKMEEKVTACRVICDAEEAIRVESRGTLSVNKANKGECQMFACL